MVHAEMKSYGIEGRYIMQASAWDHASPWVQGLVTLIATMSDSRQGSMEIRARVSFSLADAIVPEHRLGLTKVLQLSSWWIPGATQGMRRRHPEAPDGYN